MTHRSLGHSHPMCGASVPGIVAAPTTRRASRAPCGVDLDGQSPRSGKCPRGFPRALSAVEGDPRWTARKRHDDGQPGPPPPAPRLSMPIDDRPGSVGSVQRVPRLPADPPALSRRDAGPPSPLDPRECRRPAGGYRRWGVLADDLGRSTGRMPTRSRAPRSPTTDHAPSHRRYREHVAGQSAEATVDPSRARTLQHAPEPRT